MNRLIAGAAWLAGVSLLVVPSTAQAQAAQTQVPVPAVQTPAPAQASTTDRLRVYLDCFDCFPSFLRDEIDWVDFVRQPQDGNVHLLSSGRTTGGGGREVILRFIGREEFDGHDHELRVVTLTGDTENTRRQAVMQTVSIGLLDYIAHAGVPDYLNVAVRSTATQASAAEPVKDPWNLWVFSVRGNANFENEESRSEKGWNVNLTADRVTEQWRISFGGRVNRNTQTFVRDDEDLKVVRRDSNFNWFLGRSLSPHWTIGLDGRVESSSFGNTKLSARTAPAIEFNVFPYREYATRQLRLQYQAGVEYVEYDETTVFFKDQETLWNHKVSANLDQRQTWGTLRAGADFAQLLTDSSKYRIEVDGNVDIRLTRGLSVTFNANASRIRDQLSLPLGGATPEEVLLRVRELQSGFEVRYSVGITYSFGSIFNNIVNPRFGRGGGGFGGGFGGGGRGRGGG